MFLSVWRVVTQILPKAVIVCILKVGICVHSHIHNTEVWLHAHTNTKAFTAELVSAPIIRLLECMTETEEGWSGNGVFFLMISLSQTHTQTLKFLLFRADLWITRFSSSDGTTSKGPFPFELAGFCRERQFDREKRLRERVSYCDSLS